MNLLTRQWLLPGVFCTALMAACGESGDSLGTPRETRPQPVDLVLIDGRPDPAVLAADQVFYRGNGEEPQTLDPHRAEGVPAAAIHAR